MIFNSEEFILFFVVLFFCFWTIPQNFRLSLLLIASYVFYGFTEPKLVFLLFGITVLSYFISKKLYSSKHDLEQKLLLGLGLGVLFTPLFYFKYLNFFAQNINLISSFDFPLYKIILPVGISFYTFQTAGYMVDVYRTKTKPCKDFKTFALYVSFFPQLVAGPIERADHLIPQFFQKFEFDSNNFRQGLKITAWGLFKKVVIADHLAHFVDPVYNNINNYNGVSFLIATVFFAFQIYCDFSGYSDMAIGIARTMNIKLMKNFNRPYFASNIIDFWRRWHISLSTWFRDYVYFPLGGNKVDLKQWIFNILVVFVVSGFWHGAEWTFVIWGLVHGLAMIVSRLLGPLYVKVIANDKLRQAFNFLLTFAFVNLTWVFFRASDLPTALSIISGIGTDIFQVSSYTSLGEDLTQAGFDFTGFIYLIIGVCSLLMLDYNQGEDDFKPQVLDHSNTVVRKLFQYALVLAILLYGFFGESPFIYFQF